MSLPCLTVQHKNKLTKLGVQAVYLFGSRAMGKQSHFSDYDYAVLTRDGSHTRGDKLYFILYDVFSDISPRTLDNDVIDIVFLRDTGLELRFHVVQYGIVLLDSDPVERLRFESQTVLLYGDYRPLLESFDHAILESL